MTCLPESVKEVVDEHINAIESSLPNFLGKRIIRQCLVSIYKL
jgi:hypothetical protein